MAQHSLSSRVSDLGTYLRTVEERDIDLLLMEEFHVSPEFVAWFSAQVGLTDVEFSGAWHSVSDHDGETDLLLRIRTGDGQVGVLIENKIAAPEQANQDARYHLRGSRAQTAGHFDRFVTCICAPEKYLAGIPISSQYKYRISYEAIRDWYSERRDPRHQWRTQIMNEAIQQGRRGYVMIVNSTKSQFHHDYWDYIQRRHPTILMREPTAKGSKSDWMIMRSTDMPKGVHIVHKNDKGCVDLDFARSKVLDLRAATIDWPEDFRLVQKGGSAVVSLNVRRMDMALSLSAQEALMEEAMAAVHRLIPFCGVLKRKGSIREGEPERT